MRSSPTGEALGIARRAQGGRIVGARSQSEIGLASSPKPFRCGDCKYIDGPKCKNPNPKLYGRKVDHDWCCNLYDHPGMRIIV